MGTVYAGLDPQLGRPVAIKVVSAEATDSPEGTFSVAENILREARIAARLNHPGIVQVYDAGVCANRVFVVFERIYGTALSKWMEAGPVHDREFTLSLIRQLLEAMAYAHAQGVIHCDLKPANIMVQGDGRVRVMDFGVAQVLNDTSFKVDWCGGTPKYMSPEQVRNEPLGTAADVFSLSAIFYEWIAGKHAFPIESTRVLFDAIVNQSHAPLREVCGNFSDSFSDVIDRGLSKNPETRFATAGEMLNAFKGCDEFSNAAEYAREASISALTSGSGVSAVEFILSKVENVSERAIDAMMAAHLELPAIGGETLSLAQQPPEQVEIKTLVDLAERDPILCAKILRLANSPYFGLARKVSGLRHAVTLLGVDEVLSVLNYNVMMQLVEKLPSVESFPLAQFWKHSWACGLATRMLCRLSDLRQQLPGELYLSGLLHDFGKLLLASHFPRQFESAIRLAHTKEMPLHQAEMEIFGTDHSVVGASVLESWNLPRSILDAIACHHAPENAPEEHREMAAATEYGNVIANLSGIGYSGNLLGYNLAESWFGREKRGPAASPEVEQQIIQEALEEIWKRSGFLDLEQSTKEKTIQLEDAERREAAEKAKREAQSKSKLSFWGRMLQRIAASIH